MSHMLLLFSCYMPKNESQPEPTQMCVPSRHSRYPFVTHMVYAQNVCDVGLRHKKTWVSLGKHLV